MNKEHDHKQKVAALCCIVCRTKIGIDDSPAELHHLRTGGWGKGDYMTLIPLCYRHHRGADGIHTLGTKRWEQYYGPQQEMLDLTLKMIYD
jgi:hypothetical protein